MIYFLRDYSFSFFLFVLLLFVLVLPHKSCHFEALTSFSSKTCLSWHVYINVYVYVCVKAFQIACLVLSLHLWFIQYKLHEILSV